MMGLPAAQAMDGFVPGPPSRWAFQVSASSRGAVSWSML